MDNTTQAAQAIHTIVHHLSALYTRESDQILQEQLGIGFSQFKILSTLQKNAAAQQKHISFELGQTEASVSRQIKLLQARGLLESRPNPANRREHITALTMKGERITEAAQTVLHNYQHSSLRHMSKKQQIQLLELLAKVYQP
jgi:DNA-binding MarR family transcriptional regulator